MINVRLLSSAEQDIADALKWYLDKSVNAAERLEQEIDAAIKVISQQPTRFPRIDAIHHYVLLKRFPYYIAYRIDSDEILIVAVRHVAREAS